jgi:hypothetical protein
MSTPTPRTDRQAVVSLGKAWKASYDEMHEHARTLERELATERARLDSGQILLTVSGERVWHCGVDLRAAIDAAMKEDAK